MKLRPDTLAMTAVLAMLTALHAADFPFAAGDVMILLRQAGRSSKRSSRR
ncbi:hypothetical protein BTHI11S_00561 [Bosea thiooxidans]